MSAVIPHSRPCLGHAERTAVLDVLRSGRITQGARVQEFEQRMAQLIGVRGGVAVSSGTAALELALRGLKIRAGDEVLLPSYACAALWLAVTRVGAAPRIVDIEPASYAIDPAQAAKALSRRTRAIIVVHPFGLPADLTALESFGVPLIEDCAHTLMARENGRPVGSVGTVTICSFYATKLVCTGEGGMVLSRDPALLTRVRTLREYDEQSTVDPSASNYKMTDLQAALGLRQLQRLPRFLARRAQIAARYQAALSTVGLEPPEVPKGRTHIYYRYVVQLSAERKTGSLARTLSAFRARGVECRRPVFRPVHRYLGRDGFVATENAMATALSIPLYPAMSDGEVRRITEAISSILGSGARGGGTVERRSGP